MGEIRLVGTAHVSAKSIEDVTSAIEEFSPDVIAVELDPGRLAALEQNAPAPSVDAVLKGGNFSQLLVQWMLAYLQRRIGMDTGVEPGAEMMAAVSISREKGIPLALADRDIHITLTRFWTLMPLWEKLRMFWALAISLFAVGGGEEIDVDALTDQDAITAAMAELHRYAPRGASALIDERDAYITHSLLRLSGRYDRVLAVVGAGHIQGMQRFLDDPATLPPVSSLTAQPKTFPWAKVIGGAIVAIFLFFLLLIAFSGVGLDVLLSAVLYWVVINGVLAAIGTLLAGGHPLSALTAFGVAWMTSLNPFMAAGWFAAITEAKIRKPAAADFRAIMEAEDFESMKKIPLFKVVLVAACANIGSVVGTFAYLIFILPILGVDPRVILSDGLQNLMAFITGLLPF